LWATACIPLVLWYSFLFTRLQVSVSAHGLPRWFARKLGWGILGRIFDPPRYELPAAWEAVTRTLDVVAFLGIIGAVIAALVLLRGPLDPMRLSAAMFALVPILLTNRTYWNDVFGYSRVFTPLLLLTILDVVGNKSMRRYWWMLTPVLLLEIRIGLQLAPQALGVFEGIVSR